MSVRQLRVKRLPHAEGVAVSGYVPSVLFEAAGEAVVSVAIANKIKELRAVGAHRRLQRASPRIADWPRWQPWQTISVIGRVHRQVGVVEAALVPAPQ